MTRKFCYYNLTCDAGEAESIAQRLLEQRLVACAKFIPVNSVYWWQDNIERADEVLILMESAEDLFTQVEAEVAKIHNYETFVLTAVPIIDISTKAAKWLYENLRRKDDTTMAKLI